MADNRQKDVSVKGYYYNLDISPYGYTSPYGDFFHLPSIKRVEMMEKRVPVALRRLDKLLDAHDLRKVLPPDMPQMLARFVIKAVYEEIVRR